MLEPSGTGRAQMDVLGENEALQQFFEGQDVSGVLESAAVDTSMLEQYLSNDMDPSTFILPESPPDSGSEPCSPPQAPDMRSGSSWTRGWTGQTVLPSLLPPLLPCSHYKEQHHASQSTPQLADLLDPYVVGSFHSSVPPGPTHPQCERCLSPMHSYTRAGASTTAASPLHLDPRQPQCVAPAPICIKDSTSTALSCSPQSQAACSSWVSCPYLPPMSGQPPGPSCPLDAKKRRRSESFDGASDPPTQGGHRAWMKSMFSQESAASDVPGYDGDGQNGSPEQGAYHLLTWEGYLPDQWSPLYNSNYESLAVPAYHVDTDKGFNYSPADEAFVCQKKNHFQVTVHIGMAGNPKYVKTPSGPKPIESFEVKVFGVKLETQEHMITIEQSQSDRSKKPFLPIKVSLPEDKITKVTLGRLHFSETTANNMRKKGKPNPDQRYFQLVVALYACLQGEKHLLVAHISEKIIVRASNPGQFENDTEVLWQRGQAPDTVLCQGRVGINTDAPDEALVVCGNVKVMGTVMHPSDKRAKHNIQEVDSTEQLKRIAQMRIVEYDYKPEFANKMGIDQTHETGVIAQEVKVLLPSAVREVGDVTCSDGEQIQNFLMVDKEQIFMENVGAVKQLCKLTDNLETRIEELEVWNKQLAKLKNMGSLRSSRNSTMHRKVSQNNSSPPPQVTAPLHTNKDYLSGMYQHCLHHRAFQATIITLVATMAFCVISITALYMLTLQEDMEVPQVTSSTDFPIVTSPPGTTVSLAPEPWTPDVDFCSLLYCDEVYCCPTDYSNQSSRNSTATEAIPFWSASEDKRKKILFESLKNAKDWTNTTVKSIVIKENQHVIDQKYCTNGTCRSGIYSYLIPISKFVPVNMRITIQMNTTELLVVHLCRVDNSRVCSAVKDYSDTESDSVSNTQGYIHEWPLPVARLFNSSYHFRTSVAGQADCSTQLHYREILFTDYYFHFYRRCD
ncbi:myelin regulatory factor-like protein [Scleropages formosus]|uniref:myelin regulatory factor-like protein n=1 Tax=Scleropages formosus TaxID=113540 RepID=UPI0010FA932B|nr:myelin regulatory factor-like protein [Scleropages formosus]